MGGSAKGDRPLSVGPIGELTEVASAKRAVRGVFKEVVVDELEDVLDLVVTCGRCFSSSDGKWNRVVSCFGAFDIARLPSSHQLPDVIGGGR